MTTSTAMASKAQVLRLWKDQLNLTALEQGLLSGALKTLDHQLQRLEESRIRIAVFGRVGVGKSSLVNALVGQSLMATDVAHGCTRQQQSTPWPTPVPGLQAVDLVDTPGIDEVNGPARARLAGRVALNADLVLLVLDGDITQVELDALTVLQNKGKPVITVLNRSDCWPEEELAPLLASIKRRLPNGLPGPVVAAAAPRQAVQLSDGRIRSQQQPADIARLEAHLTSLLTEHGESLLLLNGLRQATRIQEQLEIHPL